MNLPRIRNLPAAATFRGVRAAAPGMPPDGAIADALASTEDEAARIQGDLEAAHREEQAMRDGSYRGG